MEISWLSHSCFLLRGKQVTVITDPFSPQHGSTSGDLSRLSKLSAPIVTVSHNHPGHNNVTAIGGNPRVVHGPGEYEISDVLISGIASFHDEQRGQLYGRNTIYVIHMDELVICHLGDLGHPLQEEQLEEVADADVLLIPIGGQHTINATQAAEVISQIEPRIVIPMHYPLPTGDAAVQATPPPVQASDPLTKFCREMGIETQTPQAKLVVTRNSLPPEMQIVILSPR